VVLEERGVHEALSGGGSAERENRTYVVLVCFFEYRVTILSRRKKIMYVGVDFAYEHKEIARAPRKNTGQNPSSWQCYSACW